MRKKKIKEEKNVIKIKEDVKINKDVILEAGDKIKVLKEQDMLGFELREKLDSIMEVMSDYGMDYSEVFEVILSQIPSREVGRVFDRILQSPEDFLT